MPSQTAIDHTVSTDNASPMSAEALVGFCPDTDYSRTVIDLEVTSVCNAVCSFCPREYMPEKNRFIAMSVVEQLALQLEQDPVKHCVVLCGIGESTLHPELEKITETLANAGAIVCMTTNGSRITAEMVERLVAKGMREIYFSLNALTAETHQLVMRLPNFKRIEDNLLQILKVRQEKNLPVRLFVSMVVCEPNYSEIDGFINKWRHQGVSGIWLHPINNRAGLLADDLKPVSLKAYAEHYEADPLVTVDIFSHNPEDGHLCKITRALNFISADGEMRLCAMDYKRQTTYGNLLTHDLKQMYVNKIQQFASGETRNLCATCDFCPVAPK